MSRFLKLLSFSTLVAALIGGLFWFWDQSLSANTLPGGVPEDDEAFTGADDISEKEREMLLQELEAQFG